jgi:hypothetical protein
LLGRDDGRLQHHAPGGGRPCPAGGKEAQPGHADHGAGPLPGQIKALADDGTLPPALGETDEPLGFLLHEGGADSLLDAAYRFARHETGADVVLFGTGNLEHLEANIASLLKPPLPKADVERLKAQFGHLKGIGLDQSRRDQIPVP